MSTLLSSGFYVTGGTLRQDAPSYVDRHCEGLFLTASAREKDDNLLFVRERLLSSEADLASLLDLYSRVRTGKAVLDDNTNRLVDLLRLSGVVRSLDGRLQVRNRIYERVFDRQWILQQMPDAELRRQQAAYRRGLLRATGVAAAVLALARAPLPRDRVSCWRPRRRRFPAEHTRTRTKPRVAHAGRR